LFLRGVSVLVALMIAVYTCTIPSDGWGLGEQVDLLLPAGEVDSEVQGMED
jgi:hypothetical protein